MNVVIDNIDLYVDGLLRTLEICGYAAAIALLLGTLLGTFRVSPVPPLRWVGIAWVTTFRNCPLVVVLFFFAFGLPQLGLNGSYFWFGTVGLGCYTAAFVCEAVRSGITAVPTGQAEAARAVGLTFPQTLSTVILPQAWRTVIPPLGSVMIAMVKNSAIAGAFGVGGDLYDVQADLSSAGMPILPVLVGVVIGYLIITIPAGLLLGLLERKVAIVR